MELIAVGYVARAHGVRGELRVHLHAPGSTVLLDAERVFIGGQACRVVAARPSGGAILLSVEGVLDRTAAEAMAGQPVELPRDEIPVAEGEILVVDLLGAEVVDTAGIALGRVADFVPGAQDLLVIHDEVHGLERLLPLVPEFLVSFDREAKRLVVAPPEELPAEPIRRRR